jgi:hypothetical protein
MPALEDWEFNQFPGKTKIDFTEARKEMANK